jgi:hypothetical protein
LIFLALHREQPVRLFLCVCQPALVNTTGCWTGGVGRLPPRDVGVVGVVICWAEVAETAGDGGSRSDMIEMSSHMSVCVSVIGWIASI